MSTAAPPDMVEIELLEDVLHNGRVVEAGSVLYLAEDKARPMLDNRWAVRTRPFRRNGKNTDTRPSLSFMEDGAR